ncbi:MAG TPA: hypothetical protein VFC79_02695, partial [Tissierellaceae bacterium]|nr:hypothetical protein [Tissierellaceae bacterium]
MNLRGAVDRKYKLELQTLTEIPIGEIRFYEELNYAPSISDIGKVTFKIYDTIMDNGVPIKNEIYSLIKGEMLLVVDDDKYYYINSAKEKAEDGNILEKEVVAYSREYELIKRRISKYEAENRFLYYIKPDGNSGFPYNESSYPGVYVFDTIDEDGLYTGIFNEIEEMTTWRLERNPSTGYPNIPNTISKRVRGLNFADNSLLDVLNRLQEVYECHFSFDTKNKIIKVNRFEDLTVHSGIMISDKNFINELEQNIITEEIRTRIHIQDKDGKGIGDKMPHGNSYVENYEYFYDEMSNHLQNALSQYILENNTYQNNTSLLWEQYDRLLIELDESYIVLSKKKKEVLPHNETIVVLTEIRDGKTLADGTVIVGRNLTPSEEIQLSNATSEARRLNAEIQELETQHKPTIPRSLPTISAELDNVLQELSSFAGKFNMKSMFEEYENTHGLPKDSLYNEMDIYIRDEFVVLEYSASVAEIFDEALALANNLGKPRVQIEIDAENFTKMIDYEDLQGMWQIGTTIDVKHSKMEVIGQIVLLSYEHDAENNTMKLQFSNKTDFVTGGSTLAKNMAKTGYSAARVNIGASAWNKGGYNYRDDASFMAVHLNAVERATELLTGVVTEGYVIMRPNEILIMDNEDPDLAVKVWRWNLNGLGYSSTGIDGNYSLAMTMDGSIVADFISTGTLNASKITVTNLDAGHIETGTLTGITISGNTISGNTISGGSISIGSRFTVDSNGYLTASGATIDGDVTATSGNIGGYAISGDYLVGNDVILGRNAISIGGSSINSGWVNNNTKVLSLENSLINFGFANTGNTVYLYTNK